MWAFEHLSGRSSEAIFDCMQRDSTTWSDRCLCETNFQCVRLDCTPKDFPFYTRLLNISKPELLKGLSGCAQQYERTRRYLQ